MSIILPGDSLASEVEGQAEITIGPGIYKYPKSHQIIPLQAGILKSTSASKKSNDKLLYIESNSKRYIPQVNDLVIGYITGVYGDFFKVSLQNHSAPVQLSMMAFPNATKKNRPNLKVDQAVYARVSEALPDIDTEIECFDPETGKEGGFGLLDESGFIFDVNMNFARELLFNKSCIFLEKLASRCSFEIAIGINGRVWIKCGNGLQTDEFVSEKNENGDEDEIMTDAAAAEISLKDMRMTLAAAQYLKLCQYVLTEEASTELKKAFRGVL